MNDKLIDFTIGADPEFCCSEGTNVIRAENYLNEDDDFGCDGNKTIFEIRPEPSKNPIDVVNNIHNIFVRQSIKEPSLLKYHWASGSWHQGYPLGGHVHFGLTSKQINYKHAAEFLDNYIGAICLLIELPTDGRKRRAKQYGLKSDIRTDHDWGFEYRSMSSWLSSPYIAAAILCLSKTVMYEIMNNSKFEWKTFVNGNDFVRVDHERLRPLFPKIWSDIKKMHLYQTYKPYLDLLYFIISNKRTWILKNEMKECWGLINMTNCIGNKIPVDLLWSRYNNETIRQ